MVDRVKQAFSRLRCARGPVQDEANDGQLASHFTSTSYPDDIGCQSLQMHELAHLDTIRAL